MLTYASAASWPVAERCTRYASTERSARTQETVTASSTRLSTCGDPTSSASCLAGPAEHRCRGPPSATASPCSGARGGHLACGLRHRARRDLDAIHDHPRLRHGRAARRRPRGTRPGPPPGPWRVGQRRSAPTMHWRWSSPRATTASPSCVPIRHGRMAASPWTYYRGRGGGDGRRPGHRRALRARGPAVR